MSRYSGNSTAGQVQHRSGRLSIEMLLNPMSVASSSVHSNYQKAFTAADKNIISASSTPTLMKTSPKQFRDITPKMNRSYSLPPIMSLIPGRLGAANFHHTLHGTQKPKAPLMSNDEGQLRKRSYSVANPESSKEYIYKESHYTTAPTTPQSTPPMKSFKISDITSTSSTSESPLIKDTSSLSIEPFRKRRKYVTCSELERVAEVSTLQFFKWYAAKRPYFILERGIRVMHPSMIDLQMAANKTISGKAKITNQPFILKFKDDVSEQVRTTLKAKGKIAFIAAFRCTGLLGEVCTFEHQKDTHSQNVTEQEQPGAGSNSSSTQHEITNRPRSTSESGRVLCQMGYELKVYYSDLTTAYIYARNSHSLPDDSSVPHS